MDIQDYHEDDTGTSERDSLDHGTPTPSSHGRSRFRRISLLAEIGAVLVVLLIVGASIAVFAFAHNKRTSTSATSAISIASWTNVLSGYTLISLAAAGNNPADLYACAIHTLKYSPGQNGAPTINSANFTILRSTDAGLHWQDIGNKAALSGTCQLTINPTNSNELYLVTTSSSAKSGQSLTILRHSLDGGQRWTTLQPTLNIPGITSGSVWNVQQMSVAGSHLFGVQWLASNAATTTHPQPSETARLVTSSDNGQTWTQVNNPLITAQQSILSYTVDPTYASTIYEVSGSPWYLQPLAVEPYNVLSPPSFAPNEDLYKTADGGSTWHLLLKNQAFGTQMKIELASGNPQIVSVGGSNFPFPYMAGAPGKKGLAITNAFHLQMSSNGGTSWRNVPALPQQSFLPNWFVGAQGQIYAYSGGGLYYQQTGTPIVATAIAGTPVIVHPVPPQSQNSSPTNSSSVASSPPIIVQPAQTPPAAGPIVQTQIARYDPTTNKWSNIMPPSNTGSLIASTPGTNGGDILWFLGASKGGDTLYRMAI